MRRLISVNVGESFLPTRIFPSGGGMKMRVSRGCVGGGAPGTRVCAYAQLRMHPQITRALGAPGDARQVTRVARPSQAERSPATPASRPAACRMASHRPTCRRVATPRLGGKVTPSSRHTSRLRDTWERGGEGVGRNGVEKKTLCRTSTYSLSEMS